MCRIKVRGIDTLGVPGRAHPFRSYGSGVDSTAVLVALMQRGPGSQALGTLVLDDMDQRFQQKIEQDHAALPDLLERLGRETDANIERVTNLYTPKPPVTDDGEADVNNGT